MSNTGKIMARPMTGLGHNRKSVTATRTSALEGRPDENRAKAEVTARISVVGGIVAWITEALAYVAIQV